MFNRQAVRQTNRQIGFADLGTHCLSTNCLNSVGELSSKCISGNSQEPDVAFFYTCISFTKKREGRSLHCCTNCLWVNFTVIIQVTISCVYPLNKQLPALSSALYQKFATFTFFFCHFVFSVKSDCIRLMGARPSLFLCVHVSKQMYSVI